MGKGFWEEGGEEERRNKSQGKEERQAEGGRSGEIMKEEAERTGSPGSPAGALRWERCQPGCGGTGAATAGQGLSVGTPSLSEEQGVGHPQPSTVPGALPCPPSPGEALNAAAVTEIPRADQNKLLAWDLSHRLGCNSTSLCVPPLCCVCHQRWSELPKPRFPVPLVFLSSQS